MICEHIVLFISGLTQVGVEPDTVLPGQDGALPQQLRGHGEGGAGGQGHLPHGAGAGIVIGLNDAGGILHDLVHGLDHAVRRQAAVLSAQVHAAPGGEHADAQFFGGGKLDAGQVSGTGRKDIVVVEAGGAAVLHQLAHTREGGEADDVPVQPFPDLIQGGEPVEQLHVLHLGQVPGEHLIQVVMRIDQPWIAPVMAAVDDCIGGLGETGADGADKAVLTEEIDSLQNLVVIVTGDQGLDVFQQQSGHGKHAPFQNSI